MRRKSWPARLAVWALLASGAGCTGATRTPMRQTALPRGEHWVAQGGALDATVLPAATSEAKDGWVTVWGMTEVPGDSRLQMATAGVLAITRAELVKLLGVLVIETSEDVSTIDHATVRQEIALETQEATAGAVPGRIELTTGWVKIERAGQVILRVVGRLRISRSSVQELFARLPRMGERANTLTRVLFGERD